MGVKFDFRDVDEAISNAPKKVRMVFEREGAAAVADAVRSGSYQDRTGKLRSFNKYEATEQSIKLINDAEYASYVEAKGYEVLSGSFLRMVKRIEDSDNNR